jgi:hypothetical protein
MGRIDELRVWEEDLLAEQSLVARQLEPLLGRREQLISKLELVQRLLALESASASGQMADPPGNGAKPLPAASPNHMNGNYIQNAVREILEERGKPMHIGDIRTALVQRGVAIPGKGTDANVIVHLRRAPDMFTRRKRGIYTLKRVRNAKQAND